MESSVLVQPKRTDWHKHAEAQQQQQMQIHHSKGKYKKINCSTILSTEVSCLNLAEANPDTGMKVTMFRMLKIVLIS